MFAQCLENNGVNNLVCKVTGFRPTYGRYNQQKKSLTILFVGGDDGCEEVFENIENIAKAKRLMCDTVMATAREVAKQIF